jgi:4-methyl-5(b-hydroxyethyl)-thiazole monophosphate biosynthesis
MKTIFVHLANGFEEMEALVPVDIWRRAGFRVYTVSVTGKTIVAGSHDIKVVADILFDEADYEMADMLFLPGGMPGASNLDDHKCLHEKIHEANLQKKYISAICAAPLVLGHLNLLKNRRATCFPGYEKDLFGATITGANVEFDGNIITAKGAGMAFEFAMRVVEMYKGKDFAMQLAAKMQMPPSLTN